MIKKYAVVSTLYIIFVPLLYSVIYFYEQMINTGSELMILGIFALIASVFYIGLSLRTLHILTREKRRLSLYYYSGINAVMLLLFTIIVYVIARLFGMT